MIKIYRMIQDDIDLELDGKPIDTEESIGMYRVSETDNPALITKGFAFSSQTKKMYFDNEPKLRIAAPVIIPNQLIERKDGKNEPSYYVYFSEQDAEFTYKRFMNNLRTSHIFNKNHTNEMSDSFLFESMLIDTEAKQQMVFTDYGLDLPLMSVVLVRQYKSKESFSEAVLKGNTGLSLEGFYDLLEMTNTIEYLEETEVVKQQHSNINKNKNTTMIKKVINNVFFTFESLEVGGKVTNIEDENAEVSFSFEEDGKEVEVKEGVITDVKEINHEDGKEGEETKTEVKEDVEVKADTTEIDDKVENTATVTGMTEADVLDIIKPELDKLYEALAALQANSITETTTVKEEFNAFKANFNAVKPKTNRAQNLSGMTKVRVAINKQ